MKYFSTRDHLKLHAVSLTEAVLSGLAPDGGLYMPETIPILNNETIDSFSSLNLPDVAAQILMPYLDETLTPEETTALCHEVFIFDIPLFDIESGVSTLELFHGPTLAFKDVGARFMARLLAAVKPRGKAVKVVVATSGDTGSAVAAGFHQVEGIDVFVLFPKQKVSRMQQLQLTTWGDNIHAIEVNGNFDDCQRMVKQMLADADIQPTSLLTSANSINIARLLPQAVYYAWACSRISTDLGVAISVPSGNFGNLTAALLSQAMGAGPKHLIASTNVNDVVPMYLRSGVFSARTSTATMSNAMDVGNPSNFERMLHLFKHNHTAMQAAIKGYSFDDQETALAISQVFGETGYICDPHGAVAWLGLQQFLRETGFRGKAIFLETAHPAKFTETVEKCLSVDIDIPLRLRAFASKKESYVQVENDYEALRHMIVDA